MYSLSFPIQNQTNERVLSPYLDNDELLLLWFPVRPVLAKAEEDLKRRRSGCLSLLIQDQIYKVITIQSYYSIICYNNLSQVPTCDFGI